MTRDFYQDWAGIFAPPAAIQQTELAPRQFLDDVVAGNHAGLSMHGDDIDAGTCQRMPEEKNRRTIEMSKQRGWKTVGAE
jgi:hypothetical protein